MEHIYEMYDATMSNESEITIERAEGQISGSLLISENTINPAISIIISGSGPTDRNGNQSGLHNDSLKKISTRLFENGCATFRFDKRGIAQSVFPSLTESDLTIDVYVRDILAIAETLRHDYGFKNINLIGHSEGGIIALLAAQKMQVDKLVLLATPARPMSESLIQQYRERAPHLANDVEAALASIKNGHV
ncbi:Serine aminopeptidase, S33 [Enterovibrio nigricans DSM 22720]|uniref:Serine aminopeptidase, S33 n=2 Tax=Enterovibrio nigricans TaxID=504469 RepID=A0A1T4VGP4_9GAMM|nr:Serine aminopeptidase, S33 [Enterovibrio nigricans DSM 22720]